jgi:hypothetical protein
METTAGLDRVLVYALAKDVSEHVDAVHGRSIDLTLAYSLSADNKTHLLFRQHDKWTLIHGGAGWVIDTVQVRDKALTALTFPDGRRIDATESAYNSKSGEITATIGGMKIAWIPEGFMAWKIAVLATPAPQRKLAAGTFHGYACTNNCSGHEAGYDWANELGITDRGDCPIDPHNSHSFTEGCWAAAGRDDSHSDQINSDDNGDDYDQ